MAPETPSVPSQSKQTHDSKVRSWLIFGTVGLLAAIIFGLLYLFVLAPSVPGGSVGWFLFSFATGLTMIVMPCTLPLAFVIVPLSMGKGIIRGLGMALAFGLGVATMLSTYGIIAALLGGFALDFLGNDIELVKNWVYFFAGMFAFVFALGELGLINVHMPTYSGAAPAFIQKRGEIIKAFLLGLFLGNVGVGCPHPATPLILIEIATSGDILYGWLMFLVHAIGRVLPLLLLAFMAIIGVNGLNWLMTRKAAVERVTGWGMVFVAGFILTLGLFTHDWWVNSGIHSALEAITQESAFNAWFNEALDQNVAHVHGLEDGVGLFGQPLWLGHWFLVAVWLIPIWWFYRKKRRKLLEHPSFALKQIEKEVDRLEEERSRIEETANIDGLDPSTDLTVLKSQINALKKQRRALAEKVGYGEEGNLRNPIAREYEMKILGMQRNTFLIISISLALVFIYFMPTNFYLKSTNPNIDSHGDHGGHDHAAGIHAMPDGTVMDANGQILQDARELPDGTIVLGDGTTITPPPLPGTPFSKSISGLPNAKGVELVSLADGDEYDITASYVKKEIGNRTLRMLAYNESVPGPIINVSQGSEITINFTNDTDIDQTIHSHGIRLDNNSDGVPYVTQDPVKPGETYTYTIRFEDAGVYWYHPHTREDYGQELGLYGNYLVDPSDPNYWSPVNREMPLVIDDILIESGEITDFYKELTTFALLGRFGNEYLVNGEMDYTTTVRSGEVVRFYITNVANTRIFNLSLPGARLKQVGADLGKFERETYAESLIISPAERLVVEAYFPKEGTYKLLHTTPDGEVEIARFLATAESPEISYLEEFNTLRSNNDVLEEFVTFREYLNTPPDKQLLLTIDLSNASVDHSTHAHGGAGESSGHDHGATSGAVDHSEHAHMQTGGGDRLSSVQWDDPTQSDRSNTTNTIHWLLKDLATNKVNMGIDDWIFTVGDLVKVRLINDVNADHVMQHPIHFHGQQFVVLSENGTPNQNMAWKDTVLVYPGEVVDVLVDMSNPGEWMSHCHIAEHLHAGMMLGFRVQNEDGTAPGDKYRSTVDPAVLQQMHNAAPKQSPQQTTSTTLNPSSTFSYDFNELDTQYSAQTSMRFFQVGKQELIQLSFTDSAGNPVGLDDTLDRALTVTFVNSDNSVAFVTYPGNTVFPEPIQTAPADDGHDHVHALLSIPVAHAHGDVIDDGHHSGNVSRSYSVPVQFPAEGIYRGFVEFTLAGENEPRIARFDVEVVKGGFSIDNFGWSPTVKWWVLLIGSVLLILPLVWGVRKYINVEKV